MGRKKGRGSNKKANKNSAAVNRGNLPFYYTGGSFLQKATPQEFVVRVRTIYDTLLPPLVPKKEGASE
ncbi:hypothetical protein CMI37_24930 [Candidatus Pacearchaeota archaeon]|nr:hypothetical protein [Candidatus Pacearchaeota archaeon]